MPKVDLSAISERIGSGYPPPHDVEVGTRRQRSVGDAGGLTQFGVQHVTLPPGALSSLRHWHEEQDEFAVVLSGTPTLVEDGGETLLAPGDCICWPKGDPNGHHLINRTDAPAVFLAVGTRTPTEVCWYSDYDLVARDHADGSGTMTRQDGSPVDGTARRLK